MLYSVCGIGTLLLALQYIFLARQFINCVESSRYVHPWAEQEDWNILVEKIDRNSAKNAMATLG